ncbi:MAG: bifunctional metallophosphatase/5'-nucleotidase, partial [Candidatus Brocadiae bacterium]|nr:bifunctional metallophosphatase/5'-nucleotidase [Candidatus Brocadiia bacterium]
VVLALAALWAGSDPPAAGPAEVVILHTNDLHGRAWSQKAIWLDRDNPPMVGGLAALAATIRRERARAWNEGKAVVLVDAGDWFQGTPEGDIPRGRLVAEWMNLVGYDAATIGNHEFDKGPSILEELHRIARFPFLGANIAREEGGHPVWRQGSWTTVAHGTDIVFVGLISSGMRSLVVPEAIRGFRFGDEVETLRNYLRPGRVVIPVTHCGVDRDVEIAEATRVPVIIGGHSHTGLPGGKVSPSGTLIAQCWAHGTVLGRVDFRLEGGGVRGATASLVPVRPSDGEDAEARALVARWAETVGAEMNVVVGETAQALTRQGAGSSTLGNWVCDVMRDRAGVQVALTNRTGIRADLPAGPIRLRDLYEVCPFSNTLVTMELSGADLDSVLEFSTGANPVFLEVSGLEAEIDGAAAAGSRVTVRTVGGEPWDATRTYRIVTNSFLAAGGDGHLGLSRGARLVDTGIDTLEALTRAARAGKIAAPLEARLRRR